MTDHVPVWISGALAVQLPDLTADQHARIADAVALLLASPRAVAHEVAIWRIKADAYASRMVLAERVCRSLATDRLPKPQCDDLAAWRAEYEFQTAGRRPDEVEGAA